MLLKKLALKDRYTKCEYCNYHGCPGTGLVGHVKFVMSLWWHKNNPKRVWGRFIYRLTDFDYSQITEIEFDGIDHRDAPDYCDAYITAALYKGKPMTDKQLDRLNNESDFVYESLMDYLH